MDVLAGTNSTVTTGSLTLGTTNTSLNLYDNDLIVDYSGASQLAAVQAMINSARANGWVTNGLTSWTARDNPQHSSTLGAMEATDYKSIYYGDADFSGSVDFDDYVRADGGFNNNRSGWVNGDFDGNGGVDFDDYVLIDLGFNSQGASL